MVMSPPATFVACVILMCGGLLHHIAVAENGEYKTSRNGGDYHTRLQNSHGSASSSEAVSGKSSGVQAIPARAFDQNVFNAKNQLLAHASPPPIDQGPLFQGGSSPGLDFPSFGQDLPGGSASDGSAQSIPNTLTQGFDQASNGGFGQVPGVYGANDFLNGDLSKSLPGGDQFNSKDTGFARGISGSFGGDAVSDVAGNVDGLNKNININAFPGSTNHGVSQGIFPNTAGQGPYKSSNDNTFPSSVGNNLQAFPAPSFPSPGSPDNYPSAQASSVQNIDPENGYTDIDNTVPSVVGKNGNYNAVPVKSSLPHHSLPPAADTTLDSHHVGKVFTSTGNNQISGGSSSSSSSSSSNNENDNKAKPQTAEVHLNQKELNKLSGRDNLVNNFLDLHDDLSSFNNGNSFNVDDAFKNANSVPNKNGVANDKNVLAKQYSGNLGNGHDDSHSGGYGPGDDSLLEENSQVNIGKELDARSAAAGFRGYSDSQDGLNAVNPQGGSDVLSNGPGLSNGRGLGDTGPASLQPGSDFYVNANVRDRSAGPLSTQGSSLGGERSVLGAHNDRFNTHGGLGEQRSRDSLLDTFNKQNLLARNVLSNQHGLGLSNNPLSGNQYGNSAFKTGTGGNLIDNSFGGAKSSFSNSPGNSRFSSSPHNRLGNNNKVLSSNNYGASFGKQPFGSGFGNNALGTNQRQHNSGTNFDFNGQNTKSGIFSNTGNDAFRSTHGSSQGRFGNVAASGLNVGRSSGSNFASTPQSHTGNSLSSSGKLLSFGNAVGSGNGLGNIGSKTSGQSSFSSSSQRSGLGKSGGLSSGKGAFSGNNVGVGNSLTGVAFGRGGFDNFGHTGNAVVGSSKKAYDTGVVGTSSTLSGGGRKTYSTGTGSAVSHSSGTSYSERDLGGGGNAGSTNSARSFTSGEDGVYSGNRGSGSSSSGHSSAIP